LTFPKRFDIISVIWEESALRLFRIHYKEEGRMSKVFTRKRDALMQLHSEGIKKTDPVEIVEYGCIEIARTSAARALEEDVND